MTDPEKEEKISSAILEQNVECPVCKCNEVKNYTLKAKTLPISHNVFEVPIYNENPKYVLIDFNELQFTVCPECYFNGSSRSEFNFHGSMGEKLSDTDKKILNYWKTNAIQIKAQFNANHIPSDAFHHPRTLDAVILSINLAIYKATVEIHGKIPYSVIKRAHRYIRLYSIKSKFNLPVKDDLLTKAVVDLEEVFLNSDFPDKIYEFEVCYLIIACCLKLGDETKASEYIKVLDKTKGGIIAQSKMDPKVSVLEITKWTAKAKELWQNRQDPTIWNLNK